MTRHCFVLVIAALVVAAAVTLAAQTPQPFPKPGQTPPATGKPAPPSPNVPAPSASAPGANEVPTEATLGVPLYPTAQFITSYDAGRGQRYYLFGTNVDFAQIVGYYRTVLKQRGSLVYEAPPIHMFDVARYRADAVAFPPGFAVKDYTWGGSAGYLNPVPGAQPAHFRTIIQIVPPPPGVTRAHFSWGERDIWSDTDYNGSDDATLIWWDPDLEGEDEVVLWGDGSPTREWLYVDDCAEALVLAADRYDGAEPVNVGTGQEISIRELAELIAELTGFEGAITWDTSMPNGQPRRSLDTSRARELFGFEARTPLREGLERTVAWYRSTVGIAA